MLTKLISIGVADFNIRRNFKCHRVTARKRVETERGPLQKRSSLTLDDFVPFQSLAKLLERFAALGVVEAEIAAYLGHPASEMTAEDFSTLVSIGSLIKDQQATWAEVVAESRGEVEGAAAGEPPHDADGVVKPSVADRMKADLRKRTEAKGAKGKPAEAKGAETAPPPADREPGAEG